MIESAAADIRPNRAAQLAELGRRAAERRRRGAAMLWAVVLAVASWLGAGLLVVLSLRPESGAQAASLLKAGVMVSVLLALPATGLAAWLALASRPVLPMGNSSAFEAPSRGSTTAMVMFIFAGSIPGLAAVCCAALVAIGTTVGLPYGTKVNGVIAGYVGATAIGTERPEQLFRFEGWDFGKAKRLDRVKIEGVVLVVWDRDGKMNRVVRDTLFATHPDYLAAVESRAEAFRKLRDEALDREAAQDREPATVK